MTVKKSLAGLAVWLVLSFSAAWFSAQFEPGIWYEALAKPVWTPPNQLFGLAWTLLYTLMGIAAWLVWKRKGFASASGALSLFVVQLILNAIWSWLFFGLHRPDIAFAEIVILWLAILFTLVTFWHHRRTAGILLIPYLAWASFAAALNFSIWQMNS